MGKQDNEKQNTENITTKQLNDSIKSIHRKFIQKCQRNLLRIYDNIVGNFMYDINTLSAQEIKQLSNDISNTINGIANSIWINKDSRQAIFISDKDNWNNRHPQDLVKHYPYKNKKDDNIEEIEQKNQKVFKKNLKTGFNFLDNNYIYTLFYRDGWSNDKITDQESIERLKQQDSTGVLEDLKTTTQNLR